MADDITVDNGVLTDYVVATDQVTYSSDVCDVQLFRPVHVTGAEGSRTVVEITDAQGQWMVPRRDLQRLPATSASLTTTATAYTAGDQVGTIFTFASAARASGGSGTIVGVALVSAAITIGAFDLEIFDSTVTLSGGDNGAHAVSDADALKSVFTIPLAATFQNANNRRAQATGIYIPYICSGGTSLYAALITKGTIAATPFANATDIQINLYVERN